MKCKTCKREEEWRDVVGWEGWYQISNIGRVMSIARNNGLGTRKKSKLRKTALKHGYHTVALCREHRMYHKKVSRLIAEAFIRNPEKKPCVNHKDLNRKHDCLTNLEWVTHKENSQHARKAKYWNNKKPWTQ